MGGLQGEARIHQPTSIRRIVGDEVESKQL